MKHHFFLALLVGFVGQCMAGPLSNVAAGDFTGHYELTKDGPRVFALDVTQKGKEADVGFSAANENGAGAAPDGGGKGRINGKGELEFAFTDSFENTGTAVLRRDGKLFRLSMEMGKVADPGAVVHYGDHALKRTSAKPQTNDR
jgi:hypothetical protein